MIPDSFLEELKYRLDAEQIIAPYTRLKRSGRNLVGLCPFHSEKSPSFFVYPENNSYYCFGCGSGGDLITFIRNAEHLDYVEAVKFLADRAGLAMPEDAADDATARRRQRMLSLNREAARFFHAVLKGPQGKEGRAYLRNRGLTAETITRFGLGFAPDRWDSLKNHLLSQGYTEQELLDAAVFKKTERGGFDLFRNRAMFPIIDLRGAVIGFGGRAIGDAKPKYLNSADTLVFKKSRGLFAMNVAKSTKEPFLILCEGYLDAIAIHQAGFDNAVATLGTALTAEQARLIGQYKGEVVISYDSDEAGQAATRRASKLFAEAGVKVRVLTVAGAKDPDEFLGKYGPARFRELLEGSANSTEYAIGRLKGRYNLETEDGKVGFMREFCAMMAQLPDPIESDVYVTRTTRELGVSRDATIERITALRRQNRRREEKKFDDSLRIYTQDLPNRPRDPEYEANRRYAVAEDKLIAALLRNPDYGPRIADAIAPEEFVTGSNRAIYRAIYERIRAGRPFDVMSLAGDLDTVQMGRLQYLSVSMHGQGFSWADAQDLIRVIREKQQKKTNEQIGGMDTADLNDYVRGIAAQKNKTRGNDHG